MLLIYCLLLLPLFVGVLYLVLDLLFSTLCLSTFAIIFLGKREVALLLLSSICLVTVSVLWLFLAVPWVGLRGVRLWYLLIILTCFFMLSPLLQLSLLCKPSPLLRPSLIYMLLLFCYSLLYSRTSRDCAPVLCI